MGSDTACHAVRLRPGLFQSTLPGWGATYGHPHGDAHQIISIHAPRMGSDHHRNIGRFALRQFQSTLPGWGATGTQGPAIARHHDFNPRSPDGERPGDHSDRSGDAISIHAPRMGSDLRRVLSCRFCGISIHAPRMGSDAR